MQPDGDPLASQPASQMEIVQRTSHRSIYTAAPLALPSSTLSLSLSVWQAAVGHGHGRSLSEFALDQAGHNLRETC